MKYRNYNEYLNHPIFKIIRETSMKSANGVCEVCRVKFATEVHHYKEKENRYPPWGTFDSPSNLKAICHECHCKEHEVTE